MRGLMVTRRRQTRAFPASVRCPLAGADGSRFIMEHSKPKYPGPIRLATPVPHLRGLPMSQTLS